MNEERRIVRTGIAKRLLKRAERSFVKFIKTTKWVESNPLNVTDGADASGNNREMENLKIRYRRESEALLNRVLDICERLEGGQLDEKNRREVYYRCIICKEDLFETSNEIDTAV